MPSFDIVSEVNLQEVDNAVNQTVKEISTRFDFRGSKSTIEFDKTEKKIKILADDELKLRSIHQLLEQKLVKRSVDLRLLDYGKQIEGSGNALRQEVTLKNGIDKEEAKKIIKLIKDSKIKVQAAIQDEQVRVTGKSIDDLQETIRTLRAASEIGLPLQFINMRS
ncbi:MAG: YajQ family cyclic di-GMP-binding protein [Pseudobdellovibrionaceae bacterium]|uniref:YajQ family cyclic di-GMP-binding protein n=1 Tax=Oligoflexus sp. TaxID=1971216 RepID=UPI0027CB25F6|nr:YajQ family cyclic di-GMP-binding protein [Oligoflexus sp.]MDQ3231860.1 YajQ family cyclic di-GMP-binding protein [Pseudobdellovibrionaceae bacterium]HYX39805.1 YajQ family cyclic di-GMP-binding protein [Oligoflexus sp.]